MKTAMRRLVLLLSPLLGCAGPRATQPQTPSAIEAATADSDRAIATVREGIEAIGGLERWRLVHGKLTYEADVATPERTLTVRVRRLSADRYSFEYVDDRVTYVWRAQECQRLVYGVQTDCSPQESLWAEPMRVLSSLVFPHTDVAGWGVTLRTRASEMPGHTAVELRQNGTKQKLLADYGPDKRLASVLFTEKKSDESQTKWRFELSDYKEVDGLLIPHKRVISRDSTVLWTESVTQATLGQADERVFQPPMPPILGRVLVSDLPQRQVAVAQKEPQVESLIVPVCPGGAIHDMPKHATLPAQRVLRIYQKGPSSALVQARSQLEKEARARKTKPTGPPAILKLDRDEAATGIGLFMLYLPFEPID
ncbi:MAG: hypothetical protein MUC50_03775 [Myxococcota bacterium]|jgi:hypothetical protein|nr:hypothetical protein [Myxococcota bacterium]